MISPLSQIQTDIPLPLFLRFAYAVSWTAELINNY